MKISRLEISGFKSFVDKVQFDFTSGVTAVVGPNGCGKSNLVDAIRWVMGEQSVKNLRGRLMEDVIFGGSELRKPLGMAEVSLIFSTADGKVPAKYLDFHEIQVTRRLYRDGESEYLLNRTPCRLLDIAELFMDTGVGTKAYSIIEQGKIGMILLSKPEERRFLIEEAAGVSKFKSRKQVALKKVEVTRQNLLRLADIIGEIKRQLGQLQRQAKKAEKFKQLRDELRQIDLAAARNEFALLDAERQQQERAHDTSLALVAEREALVATEEVVLEEERLLLVTAESRVTEAQEALFALRSGLQSLQSRRELTKKELEDLERRVVQATEEERLVVRQHADSTAELAVMRDRAAGFASESIGDEQLLQERDARLETLLAGEKELAGEVEQLRQTLLSVQSEFSRASNQHLTAERRSVGVRERLQRHSRDGEETGSRALQAEEKAVEAEKELAGAETALSGVRVRLQELLEEDEALKPVIAALESRLADERSQLARAEARLQSLKNLSLQFAGFGPGIKRLLTSDQFKGRFAGVVADFVQTSAEYEVALETVLGERLQSLLGGNDDDTEEALAFLRQGGGRSSFISARLQGQTPLSAPPGTLSLVAEVMVSPPCRDIISSLLGNVFVVPDLSEALKHSRAHPEAIFVTRAGDMAFGGGIVSGGSNEAAETGIVHTKREMRELDERVTFLIASVADLAGQSDLLRAKALRIADDLRSSRQELHALELRTLTAKKDAQRYAEELRHLKERQGVLQVEQEQLLEELASLEGEISETEELMADAGGRRAGIETDLALAQERLIARKNEIDVERQLVMDVKVRSAALAEKRVAAGQAIERLEASLRALEQRRRDWQGIEEGAARDRDRLESRLREAAAGIAIRIQEEKDADSSLHAARDAFEQILFQIQSREERIRILRRELEESRQSSGRTSLRLSELSMTLANLESLLLERYRLTFSELLSSLSSEPDPSASDPSRRELLKRQIDDLGEVNLTAIEQYQELEERHTFLVTQKGDLEESLLSLQQAIQKINRTTRKRFLETFALVNEKFKEIFPRLFCGGQAELRLTNEEDLLETGIEIIVQPPGKKLQNVSLLSGGEKALTAVALIFSIFLIKPSPFCLLDEVDAPLDDANIGRFNEMIREMSVFSQFILITHSKTTMAVADTLYGITMEEPGVSKLVSVKLL